MIGAIKLGLNYVVGDVVHHMAKAVEQSLRAGGKVNFTIDYLLMPAALKTQVFLQWRTPQDLS